MSTESETQGVPPMPLGGNEPWPMPVECALANRTRNQPMINPVPVPCGIEHLDFSPECCVAFLDSGFRCTEPATAYVEFHMVGYCQRFDCNEDGNACGYLCAAHLAAFENTAECSWRELQPTAITRWLTRRIGRCPSCDRPIRSLLDILQVVVML